MTLDLVCKQISLLSSLTEMGVTIERKIMFQLETTADPCGP